MRLERAWSGPVHEAVAVRGSGAGILPEPDLTGWWPGVQPKAVFCLIATRP